MQEFELFARSRAAAEFRRRPLGSEDGGGRPAIGAASLAGGRLFFGVERLRDRFLRNRNDCRSGLSAR